MKTLKNTFIVSKERLVLSVIDYMSVRANSWERIFYRKDSDLLIVFYLYEPNVHYSQYMILKVVHWTFPDNDLRIIRDDWLTIERFILAGRAHELSEGLTNFLGACTKGAGHGANMRDQPFSNIPAKQRALALKSSYVTHIYRCSPETICGTSERSSKRRKFSQPIFPDSWNPRLSFDQAVTTKMGRFVGMTCKSIEGIVGPVRPTKAYYSILARRMLGVKSFGIEEFIEGGIAMKTVRLKMDGTPKENMSFAPFNYFEIAQQEWYDSDFFDQLEKRFFIVVFQLTDRTGSDYQKAIFKGAFFWTLDEYGRQNAQQVWERTRECILNGNYELLPRSSDNPVSHVRPHGRDSSDQLLTPDGSMQVRRSFWLNAGYIGDVVKEHLRETNGPIDRYL